MLIVDTFIDRLHLVLPRQVFLILVMLVDPILLVWLILLRRVPFVSALLFVDRLLLNGGQIPLILAVLLLRGPKRLVQLKPVVHLPIAPVYSNGAV